MTSHRTALRLAGGDGILPGGPAGYTPKARSAKKGKKNEKKPKTDMQSMISAAVAAALKPAATTPPANAPDATKIGNYLIALMKANPNAAPSGIVGSATATAAAAPAPAPPPPPPPVLDLQSILKKAKHG
jgi:hypothetical protein